MKSFISELRSSIMATVVLGVACCGVYPVVVWSLGQAMFSKKANGSLIVEANGTVRGSELIGQSFTAEKYFHPRPSAAGNGYDATSSGGSNLGPTSKKLADTITGNIAAYRAENGLTTNAPVPADAVTTSGSGLDPHISPANAELQVARIAKARNIGAEKVRAMVRDSIDAADFGVFGEPGVNVLRLNLALDKL
ncbi:MAG TPA: K(+)-transporting ATPase subunit C [Candidatus Limnocylindria bacterium]|jgi:K+-transporting ATPase ATPase C chain|nr:K(+)-transporting ATPase subunit C [Candidatus Limnocylindria bacterium]